MWNGIIGGGYQAYQIIWSDQFKRGTLGEESFWSVFISSFPKGNWFIGEEAVWQDPDGAPTTTHEETYTSREAFYFGPEFDLDSVLRGLPRHDWELHNHGFYFSIISDKPLWELFYNGGELRIERYYHFLG